MKKNFYFLLIFLLCTTHLYSQTNSKNFSLGDTVKIELLEVTTTSNGNPLVDEVFYDLQLQKPNSIIWEFKLAKDKLTFTNGVFIYIFSNSDFVVEGVYKIRGRAVRLKNGVFINGNWSDELDVILNDNSMPSKLIIRFK